MDALVVAGTVKQQHALCDVFNQIKYDCIVCDTAAEARRATLCRAFDLFIVNGGLPDERGNELCADIADGYDLGGIYIDDFSRADMFADELASYGIITLKRPITKTAIVEAAQLIAIANTRVRTLKEKNLELASKLEDIKYISRAKIVLMRSLGYTEDQAHKFIEKKSMDARTSRRKVAMDILKTYEAN